jgi:hypothetical protein
MHHCKTVAQILLILSIFNLVFGAPVVRDIYYAHDDLVVPTSVSNVAVMPKERHQSRSNGATASPSSPPPDGSTSSDSLPLLPSRPPPLYSSSPSDGEADLHESPTPPSGPSSLSASSSSDREGSLHELLTHPGEPTSLAVSSPPGETDGLAWPSTLGRPYGRDDVVRFMIGAQRSIRRTANTWVKKVVAGIVIIGIASGVVAYFRHRNPHRRTIDPDWYVSNPSYLSRRRLNVPNNKRPDS